MQQCFGGTDREGHALLTGKCPGEVDGSEGGLEGERQSFFVSRLTVCEPGELRGIGEGELQLETCPVDVEDVMSRHRGVG